MRIFDVAVNGETVVDNLDLWAEAGYCGALKRVVMAKAENGRIRISFPEVKAGQAVICGIAIASAQSVAVSQQPATTVSWRSFDTDTIAKLPKEELPQDLEARPATVYEPTANTTGNVIKARMTLTDSKRTTLVDRVITFPPTPNKFKMLSTTTGTQINAGTYTLRIEAKDVEFKELEIQ